MDADLILIMGMIVTVTAILGLSIIAVVRRVYDFEQTKLDASGNSARAQELEARTELLEDRVRVLERLATDRGTLLSDEIEKLRDERSHRQLEEPRT